MSAIKTCFSSPTSSRNLLLFSLIAAAVVLFSFLGTVPGLHGDEAWVGTSAHGILGGDRPVLGMNGYTGSLHQYLVAPLLWALGYQVWALRLFGALSSWVCVYLYFRCCELVFDRRVAGWSTLVLVSMPFFCGYGRIANEVFMLNPLFALSSVFWAVKLPSLSGWKKLGLSFLIGFIGALGIWTHLIFLTLVASLGLCALVFRRAAVFKEASLFFAATGAAVGLLPRIVHQIRSSETLRQSLGLSGSSGDFLHGAFERMRNWPEALGSVIHGDILFQRFTGAILFPTFNYSALLSLGGLLACLFSTVRGDPTYKRGSRFLIVFSFFLLATTLIISPGSSDRYFLLVLFLSPVFIILCLSTIEAQGMKRSPLFRFVLPAVLSLFVMLNFYRLYINYFRSFLETGGRTSLFYVGGYAETSDHYIDSLPLFNRLQQMGTRKVCGEFLLTQAFEFYKLSRSPGFDTSWDEKDCVATAAQLQNEEGIFAVVYNGGYQFSSEDSYPGFKVSFTDSKFKILAAPAKSPGSTRPNSE